MTMYSYSYTTMHTYDKANQLVSSTTNGKVTEYAYDATGRLFKEGDKSYSYGWLDKVLRLNKHTIMNNYSCTPSYTYST